MNENEILAQIQIAEAEAEAARKRPSMGAPGKPRFRPANPGETPDSAIDETPEDVMPLRPDLQYHSAGPEGIARNLEKEGFEVQPREDGQIAVRSKKTGKWGVFDESRLTLTDVRELLGDAQDIGAGIVGAVGPGLLGAATTGPGGLAWAAGGAAAATGVSRAARVASGRARGWNEEESIPAQAAQGAVEGAVGEFGGAALAKGVKAVAKGVKGAASGARRFAKGAGEALQAPEEEHIIAAQLEDLAGREKAVGAKEDWVRYKDQALQTKEYQHLDTEAYQRADRAALDAKKAALDLGKTRLEAEDAMRTAFRKSLDVENARLGTAKAGLDVEGKKIGAERAKAAAEGAPADLELRDAVFEARKWQHTIAKETKERTAGLDKAIARGKALAMAPLARQSVRGRKLVEAAAQKGLADARRKILVQGLPDPAVGLSSETLHLVPEVRKILQKHFGAYFRNEIGDTSMDTAKRVLDDMAKTNPEGYTKALAGYVEDVSHWLLAEGKFSTKTRRALISVSHGNPTAQDLQAFKKALLDRVTQQAERNPRYAEALRRVEQARTKVAEMRTREAAGEVALTSNEAALKGKRVGLADEAHSQKLQEQSATYGEADLADRTAQAAQRDIPIAREEMKLSQREANLARNRTGLPAKHGALSHELEAIRAEQAAISSARSNLHNASMQRPLGTRQAGRALGTAVPTAAGAILGAPFGMSVPGAIAGAAVGASGAASPLLAKIGRAMERLAQPGLGARLARVAPRPIRAALYQIHQTLKLHGKQAAIALVQTLVQTNPELEAYLDRTF